MKKNIRSILQRYLPLLVAAIAMLYPLGDHLKWWDKAAGRTLAASGLTRLASPENYPKIIVFDDEPEFRPLLNLVLAESPTAGVRDLHRRGRSPSAIVRFGGTLRVPVGVDVPGMWPNPNFAPDASPVYVMYDYTRKGATGTNGGALGVGTLGDVRAWISENRERERFLVSSLLIGLLSLFLVILDITKPKTENERNADS